MAPAIGTSTNKDKAEHATEVHPRLIRNHLVMADQKVSTPKKIAAKAKVATVSCSL